MRVDNPEHGKHDHGFGLGAHDHEPHDVAIGGEQIGHEAGGEHGLFDSLGHGAETGTAAALGGHVDSGHLTHDFGHDGLHEGLDGLHDSVSHSLGLGFEGDQHHSLHDGLHESLHDTGCTKRGCTMPSTISLTGSTTTRSTTRSTTTPAWATSSTTDRRVAPTGQ